MKVYIITDEDYQVPKDCLKEIDIDKLVEGWLIQRPDKGMWEQPFSQFIEEKCK